MADKQELLVLNKVTAGYGEAVVLEDVSLSIKEGDSVALLGRNGMGKTTLLLTMMGLTHLHKGSLSWEGGDISHMPTYKRAHAGLGWVPQERHMYPSLSVEEHLTVVARPGAWTVDKIYEVFPRLFERRQNMGNQLSGGEQQMLAIARALMVNPRLLLLDEPMEGLAPIIVQELMGVLRRLIDETGLSVIIVEQHARMTLGLTERAVVLDRGRVIYDAGSQYLLDNDEELNRMVAVA
ncbi:ABC transporter ATP-binding protein [Pusillimonas sp. CC-YST705]|uniref:ABC transporter ATP-binding protein n=1 Tax=Mesopusillimonas faecipullorum TaxID=2755040 RepID=A0ABS8CF92_9BURK|nr:ABC transporter ATP-binding protein [Mesopusillimonas faecipullorum]MCB5364502.1 ABC transporter ATP-binding protein [Mesopusillimonas faecipullorum]